MGAKQSDYRRGKTKRRKSMEQKGSRKKMEPTRRSDAKRELKKNWNW